MEGGERGGMGGGGGDGEGKEEKCTIMAIFPHSHQS